MSWRAWMLFVVLGLLWGVPYLFIKIAVQELAPVFVAWSRIALGAVLLIAVAWKRGALRGLWQHRLGIALFALFEFVIAFPAISYGERWISSSLTGILIATVPMTIALLSRGFGIHEPISTQRLIGLLVGFAGVVTLLGLGPVNGAAGWTGVASVLVATLSYALGALMIQRFLRGVDSLGAAAASLMVASVALLIPALWVWPTHWPSPTISVSIGVLGVFCTALAMLFFFQLITLAGAARASIITYINPAVATLLGVAVLHEHLGGGAILGLGLILIGSLLATRGVKTAAAST